MKSLEDMSLGHRVMLTALIIIIALLLLAAFGYLSGSWDAEAKVPYDCVDPTERERIRDLALVGIDDGLKQAMTHLFETWVREPNTEQPKRAQVGTTNSINAHNRARKLALAWDPPLCESNK